MTEKITWRYVEGDPRTLTLLDRNARFMKHETYQQLVANVKKDGGLSSTPTVWLDTATGKRIVLSGNHRTRAAIDAELNTIGWLETDQPLSRQRRLALQLSHNAIAGEDDLAVLKELFDELEDLAHREYAGLDDKTLELLDKVDVGSLNEANLTYATLQVIFLPHELEDAQAAFNEAVDFTRQDERWLALVEQHRQLLDALDVSRAAGGVQNTATALALVLDVFNAHLTDLRDHWYDPDAVAPRRKNALVPLETVVGSLRVPGEQAAIIAAAVEKAVLDAGGDVHPMRALELICADYLAAP